MLGVSFPVITNEELGFKKLSGLPKITQQMVEPRCIARSL